MKKSHRSRVRVSKKGRVCHKTGCRQKLSIYNHDIFCHVHAAMGQVK